jgi:RNA polymerase sigma-70 factor (ECF subfamily)
MTEQNAAGPSGVYDPMSTTSPPMAAAADAVVMASPAAIAGDAQVADDFGRFYTTTWPGVARGLTLVLGDSDLAVEATDEAMARAYARWSHVRDYDNPAGWVYRVGLNWARSHHRRLARRLPPARGEADPAPPPAEPAVREALMRLPVKLRSVVVCRLLMDWSVNDTAAALGVRPGTVQSRLHRALQSLASSLQHLR